MTETTRARILVAEDDPDILELVVFKLTEAGFDTIGVTDGTAALAAIEAEPPRLAILDIQMPGLTGIEVLRQVRANATIGDLDIILLSAYTQDSDVDTGFAAGATDYVVKPFSPQELLHRVNALTEQNLALQKIQERDQSIHKIILDVGKAIRTASDTQQALDVMCAALGEGLGVDRVLANMTGESPGSQLSAQWHHRALQPMRDLAELPEPGDLARELWVAAGLRAEDDLLATHARPPELGQEFIQDTGARAAILVPIGIDDRVIGIIYVLTVQPRAWSAVDTEVAQAVAGFVAKAIVAAEHQAHQLEYVERMARLDRQKSDFLATVSHELRTPLTSISGYVELLQGEDSGSLTAEQQQRMFEAISRNTVRLRSMIEDVMVLSRVEGGINAADFVELSSPCLLTRVGEAMSSPAQSSAIQLEINPGPESAIVLGDQAALDRAVVNILSNAIKFSHPGGVVTLTGTLDHDTSRVLITCQDHGFGIPAHDQADLFTRFFRASNATDQVIPGTGLGLSIARQIVQDHGGDLRLTSVESEGTTVVIDLPMCEPSQPEAAENVIGVKSA